MDIKKRYARFKAWQRKPFNYGFRCHDLQHCNNCGHDFTGNFCPYCAQRAGTGRITWNSVLSSVTLLWGMDSRSLPYTLLQLAGRPGYFIRDYIGGRRQISFPPIKMLVIVALIVTLIEHFILPQAEAVQEFIFREGSTLQSIEAWFYAHKDWSSLFTSTLFILPVWLLFRHAPAYPHHTIPEGFFIQVFLCTVSVLADLLPRSVATTFMCFYTVVTFRQLFGYGWRSTFWRFFVCLLLMLLQLLVVVIFALVVAALLKEKSV